MAKPASIMSTLEQLHLVGKAHLLIEVHAVTGACSPSRKVVSKMATFLLIIFLFFQPTHQALNRLPVVSKRLSLSILRLALKKGRFTWFSKSHQGKGAVLNLTEDPAHLLLGLVGNNRLPPL